MDQARVLVHDDEQFHPVVPLVSLLCLVHPWIPLTSLFLVELGAGYSCAAPPLGIESVQKLVTLTQTLGGSAATLCVQKFTSARSSNIAFSISTSARTFLSLAFSFSS